MFLTKKDCPPNCNFTPQLFDLTNNKFLDGWKHLLLKARSQHKILFAKIGPDKIILTHKTETKEFSMIFKCK